MNVVTNVYIVVFLLKIKTVNILTAKYDNMIILVSKSMCEPVIPINLKHEFFFKINCVLQRRK